MFHCIQNEDGEIYRGKFNLFLFNFTSFHFSVSRILLTLCNFSANHVKSELLVCGFRIFNIYLPQFNTEQERHFLVLQQSSNLFSI